jgi:hypothetical protein
MAEKKLELGTETDANARLSDSEKTYMREQLSLEKTKQAKQELKQYETTIMIEWRDANYVFLNYKEDGKHVRVEQMREAIKNSDNEQAIKAITTYEEKMGTDSYVKLGGVARVRSYPIALYQTLLYINADSATQKILGPYGPCGCGIDGIFGLQTLLTSGKVMKNKNMSDFHGVMDEKHFEALLWVSATPAVESTPAADQAVSTPGQTTTPVSSPDAPQENAPSTNNNKTESEVSSANQTNEGNKPVSAPVAKNTEQSWENTIDTSPKTPDQLTNKKTQIDAATASTDAQVKKALELKNKNDTAWAIAALEKAKVWYTKLIAEATTYNLTQTDENKKVVVEDLQMKLDETNRVMEELQTLNWVESTGIDVEQTVDKMRDTYKIGLIADEIVKVRQEMETDIFSKINKVERKNDQLEIADFQSGFLSLEKQIRGAKTSADALKIRETGMQNMLNPKFVITTEFDEKGTPIKTGESLNKRWDDRKSVRSFLDKKLAFTLPEISTRLASTDVAKMWMTILPNFVWLDKGRVNALNEWKDTIKQLDAQEAKVATARGKVIALINELGEKKNAHKTVEANIKAEQEKLKKNTWGDANRLKTLEAERDTLTKRISQLEDMNWTPGEISRANITLSAEKQTLDALKGPQWSEQLKSEGYSEAVDQYGKLTLAEVDTWNTENMWRTTTELEANRWKREQFTTELETTKTGIAGSIDAIQVAIDEWRSGEVGTLQASRDELINKKIELEKAVADVDFADRVAYKREYTIVAWSLEAEWNKLKDDENVLSEQLNAKKSRLANALAWWSMAERTETKADRYGIEQTEKDAAQDKESLAGEARQLITDMYGGNADVTEEISVPIVGGTQETRVIKSTSTEDKVTWTATMKSSYRGIGKETVQKETIDENASSLYGKREFNRLQQKEVQEVNELMGTWNEYVDAEMKVHVLQQQINIADQDKTAWKDAETKYQGQLKEVDGMAVAEFTDIKTYAWVENAYNELTERYFAKEDDGIRPPYFYKLQTENPTLLNEELALHDSYKKFIDLHSPTVTTAKSVITESQTKQQELTTRIASLNNQLTSYEKKLNVVDENKTTKQETLDKSTNSYRTEYKETLVDPKWRTNEDEKTTTD